VANAAPADITMEILDGAGKTIRSFSSAGSGAALERLARPDGATAADAAPGDEGEGGFRMRSGPTRLDQSPGMHRFTWDLRYPGPWLDNARPQGPNGPVAAPGKYGVRLTIGSWTSTQQLTIVEDPRVTREGVTTSDLREQFEHNLRMCNLVSDMNKTVARVRAAQAGLRGAAGADADKLAKLNELAGRLITPPVRYSQPELQTHVAYLYGMTNNTDQKVGRDAVDRYGVLRKELDGRMAELDRILGSEVPPR
jgi:hypothetical protein